MTTESNETIRQKVRDGYADIAKGTSKCCCGSSSPEALAGAIGYSKDELDILPEGANMGLSCGNPTAIADLKPGQVVLDLGSGAGFDVFVAAKKVGASGRAIGVDMTPQMLSKARASIAIFSKKTGLNNVEFRLGEIERLPVADNSVDVVISNCVINLSPDKQQVWSEIARVLKPGGKACVSDLALTEELPQDVQRSVSALIGCLSGAVLIEQSKQMIASAGLIDTQVSIKKYNMDIMDNCNDELYKTVRRSLPADKKLSDYVVSVDFITYKEAAAIDKRIKELIAIGASVACNCHPCVKYHTEKAEQMGLDNSDIKIAFEVGRMVSKGAAGQMDSLLAEIKK